MKSRFTGILTLFLAFMIQFSFAQEKTITGTVTSADDGLPLPGATVMIQGTTRGTQTDLDGNFSIIASPRERIVVSFIGMTPQVIAVGASDVVNFILTSDNLIETIEIDSYRKITPRTSVVSAKVIDAKITEERANANALQSLQGQIAGVNISAGSGQPGATPNIIIRGIGSINGSTDPLFVIDGMPVDATVFRTLNPNDISTYSVLKDAAATSIYGNRGANGVVVITTKKGRFNEDLQIRYIGQTGFSKMQDLNIELMSSSQLLNFQKHYNQGAGASMEQWEIDQLARNTNTYWTDQFFRTSSTEQHDLSISSGSEKTSNYTSLSYLNQEGIFVGSDFKRFNVRNNFSGRTANDKFDYSINMNMGYSKSGNVPDAGSQRIYFNPFRAALHSMPFISPYDADGSTTLYGDYFPGAQFDADATPIVLLNSMAMNTNKSDELKLLAGFSANYEFVKNMTVGLRLSADYSHRSSLYILHPESILGPFQTNWDPESQTGAQYGGMHQEGSVRDFRFNGLYSLGYSNTFNDKHNVSVTAFLEYNKAHRELMNFTQRGLDPRFVGVGSSFIPGTTIDPVTDEREYIPVVNSGRLEEGLFSYFATGSYDFDQKYAFSATIRRDASFRFVGDNRWGTFWSVGGAWNIDKENFMENSGLSYLKLRGSFGTNGNQYVTGAMFGGLSLTRSLYGTGVGYGASTATYPTSLGYNDLVWETVEQANIGLDFGVFNDRLQGSVDVYQKTTKDLYNIIPVSFVNATDQISGNIGSMRNRGIELDLNYSIFKNDDWLIRVNANGSYNKNEITKLHESFGGLYNAGGSQALAEGESYGSFYVSRYIGVNPANGNPLFLDIEGNPTERLIDDNRVFVGKASIPTWQGGFSTLVAYKGFEFSTQWTFMADVYRSNMDYAQLEDSSSISMFNKTVSLLDAWQNPGDITSVPRVGTGITDIDHVNMSDRYIEDASFLRLRNLAFAYSFSNEQLSGLPLVGLRIFAQAENILTFSKYRGWDVESGFRATDNAQYPTPKIYTLGVMVNF